MDDPFKLAQLLAARLCHDLSGLLGSLIVALELLAEDVPGNESTILAVDAAAALGHRLKLLRAAWAGPIDALDLGTLTSLARGLESRRASLNVAALPHTTVFAAAPACLLLNILLLATEAMPRGGTVRLAGTQDDLTIQLDGIGASWPSTLPDMLADEPAAWAGLTTPRGFQSSLTALLARQSGLLLTLAPDAPTLRLHTN